MLIPAAMTASAADTNAIRQQAASDTSAITKSTTSKPLVAADQGSQTKPKVTPNKPIAITTAPLYLRADSKGAGANPKAKEIAITTAPLYLRADSKGAGENPKAKEIAILTPALSLHADTTARKP